MRELVLRPLTALDVDQAVAISHASNPHPWSRGTFLSELEHTWAHLVGAFEPETPPPGALLGYLVYWLVAHEIQIMDVATAPHARRRGVARRLLDHVVCFARDGGATEIVLEVRRSNLPAQALYQAYGFVQSGVRPAYYQPEGEDALLMTLTL